MNIRNQLNVSTNSSCKSDHEIATLQNKVIQRMMADPEGAKSTIHTRGEIGEGLSCTVTQGKFRAVLDLGHGMGGGATGPSPGFFARAAIAGCVSIAVKMTAAREGLVFRQVAVDIETDFDDSALFGLGNSTAAPVETRVLIAIDTEEPADEVNSLVERVLEMDPWFLALRDPQKVVSSVSIYPIE